MSAAITTDSASPNGAHSVPKDLATEVRSKYAKIKGMQELDSQAIFTRDSKRLDAKTRATYEKLGFKLTETPGDLQMVADDVVLDEAARADIFKRLDDAEMGDVRIVADNITFSGGGKAEQTPTPSEPSVPPDGSDTGADTPTAPTTEKSPLISPLVAALATAGLLGSGIGIPLSFYLGRQQQESPTVVAPVGKDTNTRGILELVPEEGQRPQNKTT